MKIAVGSKNPVKINAVKLAFEAVWPDKQWEVVGQEVDSGVSKQPMNLAETIRGARNRANTALAALDGDFGVGLEGGIFQQGEHFFNSGWMVVVDKEGREGIGSTVTILLSKKVMDYIRQGKELGEVDDIIFQKGNTKQGEGHFGLMTNNHVTRTRGYKDGVIMGLARFIHPHLFD